MLALGPRRGEALAMLSPGRLRHYQGHWSRSSGNIDASSSPHAWRPRAWVDPGLIFATSIGSALEPRNVKRSWSAVCDRAGVKVRLHDLRHLAASLAFQEGADLKEVQALLRHSRLSTTADVYVEVFDSVRRGTADRMDGVLRRIAVNDDG